MKPGILYLVPNLLGDAGTPGSLPDEQLPTCTLATVKRLGHFIAESDKSAGRFLSRILDRDAMAKASIAILDEHTAPESLPALLEPLLGGLDAGILSDAGIPCVADPGAALVALAHSRGIKVVPLPGSSSLILALAASGLEGQRFSFLGYLPRDASERRRELVKIGNAVLADGSTRIFIEAPYRNDALLADCLAALPGAVSLCIAASLTTQDERIRTARVSDWKIHIEPPGKVPAVFLVGLPAACGTPGRSAHSAGHAKNLRGHHNADSIQNRHQNDSRDRAPTRTAPVKHPPKHRVNPDSTSESTKSKPEAARREKKASRG